MTDRAHRQLTPKDQIAVDRAARAVKEMVKEKTPKASLGEGYSREIIAAIGRLLWELE